jgi:hypothetical protein
MCAHRGMTGCLAWQETGAVHLDVGLHSRAFDLGMSCRELVQLTGGSSATRFMLRQARGLSAAVTDAAALMQAALAARHVFPALPTGMSTGATY